jgi:ribose-phosphate pyrophosphokinase
MNRPVIQVAGLSRAGPNDTVEERPSMTPSAKTKTKPKTDKVSYHLKHDSAKRLMLFGGRASGDLSAKIARHLDLELGAVDLKTFSNGEVYCRFRQSIRGADVFLIQSIAPSAEGLTTNDAMMELLMMIDAAKGASAHRIIAVTPWFGYARQDKKSAPREPISARVVAETLEAVGTDRVLTMDLHAGQIQGFFKIPVDHMTAKPALTQYLMDQAPDGELVIVSPDAGRAKLARSYAKKLDCTWAVMEKDRPAHQVAKTGHVVGEVGGKVAILVDDMIDTAGTLCAAAETLRKEGATAVLAVATHGVFSGKAYERLPFEKSGIEQIIVTDTLPLRPGAPKNISVVSVAPILANSIRHAFTDESVSAIFAGENQLF